MVFFVRITLLSLLLPIVSIAEEKTQHQQHQTHESHKKQEKAKGVEALSHVLRHLLRQEMQALQTGMMSIIPAYISGDWAAIENTAKKMKDSYILKQNLTDAQMHELHSLLPHAFIEKDQKFHYLAGMLEHAAKNEKPELINFYFSEMNESCLGCHSQFATHKFPKLLPKEKKQEHSH
jgi:hypothetical protein